MKKKLLLGVIIGLLAIIVVIFVVLGFFLGNIVKAGMETVGPKVTQTSLTVSSVNVSLLTGSAGVNGLVLGNPDPYKAEAPAAISMGKAAVSLDPLSVLSSKIVVKSVEMRAPEITFEGNPLGANNLKQIMDNVNAFSGRGSTGGSSGQTSAQPAPEQKPAKKLQVNDLLISGAKVHFNGATLPLPDIHLTNLGAGPDGIAPAELTKEVLGQVTAATVKAVAESVTNLGKGAGKTATESVNKLGKGLGGLFGK